MVICDRHYPLQNPVVWNFFKHSVLISPGIITVVVVVTVAANDNFHRKGKGKGKVVPPQVLSGLEGG
jgi:hypothetical protein